MKSIHYAGDILLTGDAIADAVVQYASALALNKMSDTIDVPVRFPDGTIEKATFLLGPASQLVGVPTDSSFDEVVEEALVADLVRKTQQLQIPHPRTGDTDTPNAELLDDLEYPTE
ncbi:hypothetical protein [Planctomonas psychrotolerans]|uniref:hypothetical protein n=1 Tax=Planctomonas psychrotolerans TaxID=2528712 RepID=UPI00123A0291|nr:hypothetical protein [Planctomonas psychrotolerans]